MFDIILVIAALLAVLVLCFAAGRRSVAARASKAPASPLVAPAIAAEAAASTGLEILKIRYDEDAELDPTLLADKPKRASLSPPTQKIVYDADAALDEPTHAGALILVTATAQTDTGARRKRNEDSLLALDEHGVFVVADGMGGYNGGAVASNLAIATIERAFSTAHFDGPEHASIPRRASELARAVQMANQAILERAGADRLLEGMGTTVCAARFSANKQRLYIAHVGDSRVYLMRGGKLCQMTVDHTMKEHGVSGAAGGHLSRAVGVWPVVPIDIVLGKPRPGDIYLICSDGLSKMVVDDCIEDVLRRSSVPATAAEALIRTANENGGKDNVSVIVVRVDDPFARAA
jgi:protein phosphatase